MTEIIKQASAVVIILIAAFILMALLARSVRFFQKRANLSAQAVLPLRLTARYGVIAVAILLILSALGVNINNFWTVISTILGLVAIGFVAVWSILSNISSTFLILLFKPFKVGDYVEIVGDDVSGEVVDLSVMFTTLRGDDGEEFSVPNNQFFQKTTRRRATRPSHGGKRAKDEEAEHHEANNPDHSMANLEGIKMPSVGHAPK